MKPNPAIVVVGGFLGSGKTTLLLAAARRLRDRGMRVGVITNDQGSELVDTRLVAEAGLEVEEIGGGCFCCRFSDFVAIAERLLARGPDVILAEPVGSCTDLAATVLLPIRRFYGDRFRLAPLTVLADPERARELLGGRPDSLLAYLFRKQLEEADTVWFSKADLGVAPPALPGVYARSLSARTGQGVGEWLLEVLAADAPAGAKMLDLDYEKYAAAEAALGWLNWRGRVRLRKAAGPAQVVGPLLDGLDAALTTAGAEIAHLKVFAHTRTGALKASICRNGEDPVVDGDLLASPARLHDLVLNLRALAAPEVLLEAVDSETGRLPGTVTVLHREAFRPAAPRPEHRIKAVNCPTPASKVTRTLTCRGE